MKFIIVCLALICIGCKKEAFQLRMDIPLEEVKVEVFHYASGDKLLDTMMSSLNGVLLEFHDLKEDMYTLCVSWERTLVPHQPFKRKNGKIELDVDNKYYLIKNIYINPSESKVMKVLFKRPLSKEDMEGGTYYSENLLIESNSADFNLSEKFNRIYEEEDSLQNVRKQHLMASLIEAIAKGNLVEAAEMNKRMSFDSLDMKKLNRVTDKINRLATEHETSPVSVCYMFMELIQRKNFTAYEDTFKRLKGKAATSPYYPMIKKRISVRPKTD